jgi:hypothetical protein
MKISLKGQLMAAAVASLFATGCASESTAMKKDEGMSSATVHCAGINECKGHSACATASSSCAGQNACKGQGWVATDSESECTGKGGTVVGAKM